MLYIRDFLRLNIFKLNSPDLNLAKLEQHEALMQFLACRIWM